MFNETGILFSNTLFDENASCHLAFGAAYKNTLRDYEKLTEEDLKKMKFNESMNHVDFMIGSEDLDIVGTKFDGTKAYQQIPFQYSLHWIETPGGELKHTAFLAESGIDPRRDLAEKLCKDIPLCCLWRWAEACLRGQQQSLCAL